MLIVFLLSKLRNIVFRSSYTLQLGSDENMTEPVIDLNSDELLFVTQRLWPLNRKKTTLSRIQPDQLLQLKISLLVLLLLQLTISIVINSHFALATHGVSRAIWTSVTTVTLLSMISI